MKTSSWRVLPTKLLRGYIVPIGDEKKAKHYMAEAYACYSKWGAIGLLNKIDKMYPDLVPSVSKVSHDTMTDTPSTDKR